MESFVVLPMLTFSGMPIGTMGPISQAALRIAGNIANTPSIVSFQQQNIENRPLAFSSAIDQANEELQRKADAIDAYFDAHDMPLAGTGMTMVQEAEKNGLDWRLLPAIAVRESSGGKNICNNVGHNFFGWTSCKVGFKSNEEAIAIVARNIGGNDISTAKYYLNKTTEQIIRAYNPPYIAPNYLSQVLSIMNAIGKLNTTPVIVMANS